MIEDEIRTCLEIQYYKDNIVIAFLLFYLK